MEYEIQNTSKPLEGDWIVYMEIDNELQQQLIQEICEAAGVQSIDIPEHAVNVKQFAEGANVSRENAQRILKDRYDAGDLQRAKGQDRRYYYWK